MQLRPANVARNAPHRDDHRTGDHAKKIVGEVSLRLLAIAIEYGHKKLGERGTC